MFGNCRARWRALCGARDDCRVVYTSGITHRAGDAISFGFIGILKSSAVSPRERHGWQTEATTRGRCRLTSDAFKDF